MHMFTQGVFFPCLYYQGLQHCVLRPKKKKKNPVQEEKGTEAAVAINFEISEAWCIPAGWGGGAASDLLHLYDQLDSIICWLFCLRHLSTQLFIV